MFLLRNYIEEICQSMYVLVVGMHNICGGYSVCLDSIFHSPVGESAPLYFIYHPFSIISSRKVTLVVSVIHCVCLSDGRPMLLLEHMYATTLVTTLLSTLTVCK